MIHIDADFSEVDRELGRLDNVPMTVHLELESVLALIFALTQEAVHIITGSLQGSGTIDSDLKNEIWKGEIQYGGPSVGSVNDPVNYAEYEQYRSEGYGGHDFMAPAYPMDTRFGTIVNEHVKGRKK